MKKQQLIDLGETLLKHYKYAIILYTKTTYIIFDKNNKLINANIDNIFFQTIEKGFNSLSDIERKVLRSFYFKNNSTSTSISYDLFISRSTLYRIRDKALIKISNFYSKIFQ